VTSYDDLFVAAVALIGGGLALAVSVGPWTAPYRLRSISRINHRFGEPAARLTWMLVAIVSLLAGLAIVSGVRPSYAQPQSGSIRTFP